MLLFDTGKKLERAFPQEQFDALLGLLEHREDRAATREDLRETELRLQLEIEKQRTETEKIRAELKADIEALRAELKTDIEKLRTEASEIKYSLLKWQIGIGFALVCVMAKGFGWLGF